MKYQCKKQHKKTKTKRTNKQAKYKKKNLCYEITGLRQSIFTHQFVSESNQLVN